MINQIGQTLSEVQSNEQMIMSPQKGHLSLKSRWVLWRNRVLASPKFQRWASLVPIFRGVARRRAAAQFDLVAGFVYTQILRAFVESGLITTLRRGLLCVDDIADAAGLGRDATLRLLRAGAALQIVEESQRGLWTLGEAGAPLAANTGAMAMILHHNLLYQDLADPLALLSSNRSKDTALSTYWTYATDSSDAAAPLRPDSGNYSALMAATQPMIVQQIRDAYDFTAHQKMLDIGGGSGAFVGAIKAVAPALQFGIFDLPGVIAAAENRLPTEANHQNTIFYKGSFKETTFPLGYDLITLVRILHDHDDDVAHALLAKIYAALPLGGKLLIVEPMADSPHSKRMGDAYFGLYLWAMRSGQPRSARVLTDMLKSAGFAEVKTVKTALPIITSALVAIK
jgi:demethylspheroidene O-methyltransferase